MNKLLTAGLALAVFVSCTKKTQNIESKVDDSSGVFIDEVNMTDSTLASTSTCYLEVIGKDSLFAQIEDNLGTISGKLRYKNFEKDSSFGDLTGIQSGDTLKVEYVFQAEGTQSTREIWFLKEDGKLIEGIGEYDESGINYKDPKQVKFEGGHSLTEVNCVDIQGKLES